MTSAPGEEYRVAAHWIGDSHEGAHILFTYDGQTVDLTPGEAAFWCRVITAGGMFSPASGGGSDAMAIDLGAAADVLFYLDPAGDSPDLGLRIITDTVSSTIASFFTYDDTEVDA